MSNLATNIIIGAALAGSFHSTIGSAVGGIGQIGRAAGELSTALLQVGQAWAALKGIGTAVDIAGDFEHQLAQAANTAELTNDKVASLREELRGLAVPEKTNQSLQELLKGYTSLVSAGMKDSEARASLYAIGRTATAASADVNDLAKTTSVLVSTLGVKPGALSAELDRLAFAGKQGSFELKDMAKYFPTLGAAAKSLGLQGTEAVATLGAGLQIAMRGASDPSEAANNMKNFMAKIMAPETLKKFKEHGVDLVKVRDQAIKNGQNPFEALLEQVAKKTKGGKIDLLGQYFGDMQVQDFLKPMLAGLEDYKKMKADIAGAKGTVDTDFARMMETNKELVKGFTTQLGKLGEAVGVALLPPFNAVLRVTTPVVTVLGDMANASPATTTAIIAVGAAFTLLPPAITVTTVAFKVLTTTMMANPIGLIVGGLVIGAALLIDNWGAVKSFFSTIWNGVTEHWRTILAFTGPIGWMAIKIIDNWGQLKTFALGMWDPITAKWSELVTAVAPIGEAVSAIFDAVWAHVTKRWEDGVATIMAIWEKVRGPLTDFARMMGWVGPEAVPQIGDALPANDNRTAANDNQVQPGEVVKAAVNQSPVTPGAGVAAAEANGAKAMTTSASITNASSSSSSSASAAAQVQRVEVVLTLPPGMRADVRGASAGVSVIARTGQSMVDGL